MELNYFVGKKITQLPHVLPIAKKLGGTIFTDDCVTYQWMTTHRPEISCKLIKNIKEIPPCNIILADYFRFPETFNRIQVFHGVSSKNYINMCPWDYFDVVINPSPMYKPKKQSGTGFTRFFLYNQQFPTSNKEIKNCLYCPTRDLRDLSKLKNLMSVYEVTVKLHPLDETGIETAALKELKSLNVKIIKSTDKEYIEYDELFKKMDILVSDQSSIAYEFMLTGKPVLFLNGKIEADVKKWFYNNDIIEEIKKHLK